MTDPAEQTWTYVVTDIETDGPHPGPNSMRSIACVAVDDDGVEHGRFEAVLEPLPGAAGHPETLAWFRTQPEAWAACTTDPRPVPQVMADLVAWVQGLPAPRMFAASPLGFDGTFVDHYLRRFTPYGVCQGPYEDDRLFQGPGLCLSSFAAAVTGTPPGRFHRTQLPSAWFGEVPHTHRAIDDALGYANLLRVLLERSRA